MTDQSETRPIEGQYLVIFHERWNKVRTLQAAEDVRAFTDQFLRENNIPADSVIARFEYALRGITVRMDETKAKSLMDDPKVNYVEQVVPSVLRPVKIQLIASYHPKLLHGEYRV